MGSKARIRVLDEKNLARDPIHQFKLWFQEAHTAGISDPHEMILGTATPDGKPSARVVLLRGLDQDGFVFFTNYQSRKGEEMEHNPQAAIVFHWKGIHRQVRVEGAVERTSREESENYFAGRPRESQLGAWASQQSSVVPSRDTLEDRFNQVSEEFRNRPVPCPPFWGGFRLRPRAIEFWQERSGRLHDRVRYTLSDGRWIIERLSP